MLKNLVLDIEKRIQFNHHPNIPNSFRMLIVGGSGCGKTTLLFRMLLEPNFLDYDNLLIFTTTTNQQEYQLLYHGFNNQLTKEQVASIALNQEQFKGVPISTLCESFKKLTQEANIDKSLITIQLSNKVKEIPPPDKLDNTKKHLIIFDDCINTANQKTMSSYFSRGRHSNCNCIYLSQSYFELDRMIRLNSNFVILFKLSKRNLNDIYNSLIGTFMDKKEFVSIVENIWSVRYQYIALDKDKEELIENIFD